MCYLHIRSDGVCHDFGGDFSLTQHHATHPFIVMTIQAIEAVASGVKYMLQTI